jgi:predicted nucleotidyltransferase
MGTRAKRSGLGAPAGSRAREAPDGTNLADSLFTSTQQRVLALLFGQPDRSFFATELIRLARVGRGAVQRELKRLAESGLVSVTRVGTQKHYQANPASPVFAELSSLVRKTIALHGPIRDSLRPFEDRIRFAAIYDSVAKRKETAASDVDLLVVSDHLTLEQLSTALATAEEKLARKINPTLYTSREFERRKKTDGFVSRVLEGEHIVLLGDEFVATGAG